MKLFGKLFIMSASISFFSACYYDVEEELYPSSNNSCDTTNVTYSAVISPIINTNCNACHSQSSAQGNVILEGYQNIKVYADNGFLIGAITHDPNFIPMPQNGNKLSDCNISKIKKWVNDGSPNN